MDAPLTHLPAHEIFAIRAAGHWNRTSAVVSVTEITGEVHSGYVTSWSDRSIHVMTGAGKVAVLTAWIADVTVT